MLANLRMAWYNEIRLCVALENVQVAITFPTRNLIRKVESNRRKALILLGLQGAPGMGS